jgi:hypothetical protein
MTDPGSLTAHEGVPPYRVRVEAVLEAGLRLGCSGGRGYVTMREFGLRTWDGHCLMAGSDQG